MKLLLLLIWIYFKLVANAFKIYPLNEVGDKLELKSDINETYYFFTPINNLKVNDVISYYITNDIFLFNISYTFLETDKYDNITKEDDINKYTFNSTLDKVMDFNMLFKTIIKRNDAQKGLLLRMNIIQKAGDSFTISRINMTLSERKNQTIVINKNEDKYFYFDFDQNFLDFYDVFIFPSNLGNMTLYCANLLNWFGEIIENSLYYKKATFCYINSKFEPRLRYINIKANETNSITLNIRFFKKNKFIIQEEYDKVNNIELCNIYPNQNEKYYVYNLKKYLNHFVFYNKLYGAFESYYIFLNEVNNLDDILNETKNMKKFEYPILIKKNSNLILLTYFKCLNDSPTIFELYNLEKRNEIKDKLDNYYIIQNNETKNIRIYEKSNNSNISFGLMGCELDEGEFITIKFSEYEFILDKNNKKKKLNNINIEARDFNLISYSQKSCIIKIELGQNNNYTTYPLKEYNYTNISTDKIFFVSPNIEEKYHYIIRSSFSAYTYYEENELYSFHKYLKPIINNEFHIIEVENSGKFINHNLTHLTYFNSVKSKSTFQIKKIKELNLDVNKFFNVEDYSEYILPEIKSDHIIISIQDLYYSFLGAHPYIKINDYYLSYKFLEKKFQFLKLDKGDIFKIVNFIGEFTLKINILNISNFNNNIQYENKTYQIKKFIDDKNIAFYIEPFVLNRNIKYILHIFIGKFKNAYELGMLYNNYGGISKNITLEKNSTSNDIIEYTFENIDFNSSHLEFGVIATDLETGYVYSYIDGKVENIVHEESKSNKALIIFGIFAGIIIIILIVLFVWRKKKREKDSIEIINGNLMNEKILND